MIQRQIKLRLSKAQEAQMADWLWCLTGVWNWAIRKIELDAQQYVFHRKQYFQNLLAGHSQKIGIPSHTLQGMLCMAHDAWTRCFKKKGGKPKLKGLRRRLNSIPLPDPIVAPKNNYIKLPGIGVVRFHKQALPDAKIKCGRIVKRTSGYYLCLFMDAEPNKIPMIDDAFIGIDPGFSSLLTFSNGEKIEHPRELEANAKRLGQAQRGNQQHLAARIQERMANQRKDRNHKLSRRLVSQNQTIVFSADNHKGIAKRFGKSVASSGHGQLRLMLAYKCRAGGRQYIEVSPRNSTRICSSCRVITGPTGFAGLSVRHWVCSGCGAAHDRDVNAAINTLLAGVGSTHEIRLAA
jgi:transposase